jgi:hypothetical protein
VAISALRMKARSTSCAFASADWCDFDIGGGIKRFEAGIAYPQLTGFQQVLNQLSRCAVLHSRSSGKIGLYPDQARASTFTLTSSHIVPGTSPRRRLSCAARRTASSRPSAI